LRSARPRATPGSLTSLGFLSGNNASQLPYVGQLIFEHVEQ
jgi:hypothetical protein